VTPYTQVVSTSAADDLVGELLDGRYRVLEQLAEGGMATVYLAVDTRLDREVALKVMRPHLVHDESFVARFRREARSAARLSHPGIVGVFDQGEDAGRMFLAMEYVPGQTLREVMDAEGVLSPRACLDLLEPVLDALAAAHRAGIIHRDIKPENVLIREDGAVKVADFGLARAVSSHTATSSSGVLLGTVAYLSPEQVERGVADARSDVYAAGLLLFELLTGGKAFDGESAITVAYQHVHGGVPALSSRLAGAPAPLETLVAQATARDPDERPPDAAEFLAQVRAARGQLSEAELDNRPEGAAGVAARRTATTVLPAPVSGARHTERLPALAPARREVTVPPGGAAPRRRRALWPWVLVLLSALLLAGTSWFFFLGPGSPTKIPAVVGKSVDVAQAALTTAHLHGRVVEEFSETVGKNVVISTDPKAGDEVRQQSVVTLAVSKGPERYAVPKLAGMTLDQASAQLAANKLALGKVTSVFHETVPEQQVISSSPAAGESLKPGAEVALTVSKGREPIPVQDFTGKPAKDALAAFKAVGLVVNEGTPVNSDTVPSGSVVSQSPPSGTLFKGDTVTIVVSKGPVMVEVPKVIGKQVDAARAQLEGLGFQVRVEGLFGGFFGTVRFQEPGAGTSAPKGSTIVLKTV
jgi:beta-lactam-binding protein with PASTA domain/tRNA A-37 threonylcarbamoyl transferase component Bud32